MKIKILIEYDDPNDIARPPQTIIKEWKEFEEKERGRTQDDNQKITVEFMEIFKEFGQMREFSPEMEIMIQKLPLMIYMKKLKQFNLNCKILQQKIIF